MTISGIKGARAVTQQFGRGCMLLCVMKDDVHSNDPDSLNSEVHHEGIRML